MPEKTSVKTPSYRCHRPSGQAVCTVDGRDHYLGKHGTKRSRDEFDRLIAEWLAGGRRLPVPCNELSINELIVAYWRFANTYYRKHGEKTLELYGIRAAARPLKQLYGRTRASSFGPLALKTVRQAMIEAGHSRKYINDNVNRIKRMFRWAVGNEMIPPAVDHGLRAVEGLRRGRSVARESEPVRPVPQPFIEAVLPHVSPQVAAMIRLQLFSGMRPGETVLVRASDIDVSGAVWVYRPHAHKVEHFEIQREVYLGPGAQDVLRPFLGTELERYVFSPADAEDSRNAQRRAARTSPMTPSQAQRRRKRCRRRAPSDRYTAASYRRAIHRACDAADRAARREARQPECKTCEARGWVVEDEATAKRKPCRACSGSGYVGERLIPAWAPNRLRHNFATRIRRSHGIEKARILLGHQNIATSEIYAEADQIAAQAIVVQAG